MKLSIDFVDGEFMVSADGLDMYGFGLSLPTALANLEQRAEGFELSISPEAYERAHVVPGLQEQLELPL